MELSDNAKTILEKRYLKRAGNKIIETPEDMFYRVAKHIASSEKSRKLRKIYKDKFFNLMTSFDFLPNSPTLMNAGLISGSLSACFVLPIDDCLESIFDAVKHSALISQYGGGVGYNFSHLRPKNDYVKTTNGIASGVLSFMEVFDKTTEIIKQGGRRRGANMGILNVNHPEILEFINMKNDISKLTNFNISVGITDDFMECLVSEKEYDLINPRNGKLVKKISAKLVWQKIISNAWETGEPGLIFLDRINKDNPLPGLGRIESTNPCGEACLMPYEACNLGSINLGNFVKDNKIDYNRLDDIIKLSIRFLDNVIDVNEYVPSIPKIKEIVLNNRKIGLGIMGYADMLVRLGIEYGSDECISVTEELLKFFSSKAVEYSEELSLERGSFPNHYQSVFYRKRRNASLLSIAPTGSISIIADCSPGIEPLFGLSFNRNVMDGVNLSSINQDLINMIEHDNDIIKYVNENGNLTGYDNIDENIKKIFKTTYDIDPYQHLMIQSIFQKYVDMSVSKTINLNDNATKDDIDYIYRNAWYNDLKGITVYRNGSRTGQVITQGNEIPQMIYNDKYSCPECGKGTIIVGSCSTCQFCGYSKCS